MTLGAESRARLAGTMAAPDDSSPWTDARHVARRRSPTLPFPAFPLPSRGFIMRRIIGSALTAAAVVLVVQPNVARAQDASRAVTDGGIAVKGWAGKIDSSEAAKGLVLENAKLVQEGNALHVTTGPAVTYWNPANVAKGNYTVKATFTEPKYMSLNNHPHPYGIVIGGNGLGTDKQSYLYCAAYGNGNFIVRGFGPSAFQVNGRRGEAHAAVNKAAGPGQPVTQEIAVTVTSDNVQCSINGTVVGTYPKADLIAAGKLTSTDGVYGIRFAHNTEALVTGLTMTKGK